MSTPPTLNLAAGILHCIIGVIVAVWWSTTPNRGKGVSTSMYTAQTVNSTVVLKKDFDDVYGLVIALILAIVFITACFHFVLYGLKNSLYKKMIGQKNNFMRWVEYAITSSMLILVLLFSIDQKQLDSIILITIMNVVVMLMGNLIEKSIKDGDRFNAIFLTTLAWILFAGILFITSRCFNNTMQNNKSIPPFVPAVFGAEMVMLISFGCVQLYQLIHPKTNYEKIEKTYIFLSFISKSLLALIVTAGSIARKSSVA